MTQSSTDSLVERLRDGFVVRSVSTPSAHGRTPDFAGTNALLTEAASRISTLERELEEARARFEKHSDYSIQLQRIIEAICHGRELRPDSAELHHHKMAQTYLTAAEAKVARMGEALEWYGERALLARLIHSGGDPARFELSDDGGKRARAALQSEDREGGE